jgi:hypothetical protein
MQIVGEPSAGVLLLKARLAARIQFLKVYRRDGIPGRVDFSLQTRNHLFQTFNLSLLILQGLLHKCMHLNNMGMVLLGAFLLQFSDLPLMHFRDRGIEQHN